MTNGPEEKQPPVPPKATEGAGTPPVPAKPAAAAPPKPPAPPKEGPVPLDNELVKRYRARFGEAIREAWTDRKQAILVVAT